MGKLETTKTITRIKDNRTSFVKARPLNCDFETSLEKRCKYCGQNHLIPGYCQALDPINSDKYPELHQKEHANTPANVLTSDANTTQIANADEDKIERRKAYQRELMRKRRAEGKA